MNVAHRHLDQVGRRALQGRVLRGPLGEGAHVEVLVADLRDVAAAAEQRLDVALLAGESDLAVEKGAHAGEALEVLRDEVLRLLLRDAELAREGERALAVDGAEVDRLGAGPHLAGHLRERHAEDDRRRLAVDVAALRGTPRRRPGRPRGGPCSRSSICE